MSVGVGARSARLLRCGTGFLTPARHARSFPVVKRPIYTRGLFKPTSSLWDDAPKQNELPATRTPPNQFDNVEGFLALTERGKATFSDANRFLWSKRRELEPLPLPERRERAARVGAGRVLLWIWNHRETFPLTEMRDSFATVLVWFLHAEGLEEFIWDWITLEVQDRQSQDTVDRDRLLDYYDLEWCSGFFSGLVAAAASWSSDGSPNGAVLQLLRAVEQFGLQSHRPNTVNLEAAGYYVAKMIKSCRGHTCDPVLFEQLMAGVHNWQPDHSLCVLARASFLLYHPMEVDGKPWFDVVHDVFDGENCLDQDPAMGKKKVRKYWARSTLRAAYILSLKGDESKAAYLGEISQKHFPATWATRDERLVRFREDIRLKRLTRNF